MSLSIPPTTVELMTQLDPHAISALQTATRRVFELLRETHPFLSSALISLTTSQYAPDVNGGALSFMHLDWQDGKVTVLVKEEKPIPGAT